MSDAEKAYQATPASTLEEEIMNPCIAKGEREWWAAAEIERLRAALEEIEQVALSYVHMKYAKLARAALTQEDGDDDLA
jgi:hypothetical protein